MDNFSEQEKIELGKLLKLIKDHFAKFLDDTKSENHIQIILRSHLYIENELNKMLINVLEHPEVIGNKLRFMDKLRLIIAMGILPKEEMEAIKRINNLRNSIAHNLDFEINDKVLDEIINSLSAEQRHKVTRRLEQTTNLLDKLRAVLFETWLLVFEGNRIPLEQGKRLVEYELWLLENKSMN